MRIKFFVSPDPEGNKSLKSKIHSKKIEYETVKINKNQFLMSVDFSAESVFRIRFFSLLESTCESVQ